MEIFGFIIIFISLVIVLLTWRNDMLMRDVLSTIHEDRERRHQEFLKMLENMAEGTAKISE